LELWLQKAGVISEMDTIALHLLDKRLRVEPVGITFASAPITAA
jgi:hypothetical protein